MMRSRGVLLVLPYLVTSILAQGSAGGSQSDCDGDLDTWIYKGCYSNADNGKTM